MPIGTLAFIGAWIFLRESRHDAAIRLDWLGFATLSVAIGGFQMMLDRGTEKDWFSSPEIIAEATIAGVAFYLFLVQIFTARQPFIRPRLFRDRNFTTGTLFVTVLGVNSFAALSLQPPFLQELMNDPIVTAGLVMGPRGLGTIIAMLIAGQIMGRVDTRLILGLGLLLMAWAFHAMSGWTPDVSNLTIMSVGIVQGLGQGMLMVPLSTISLSSLSPAARPEGAGIYNLARTLGSSAGISMVNSLLAHNIQVNHANIATYVTAFNRNLGDPHIARFWSPFTVAGRAALDAVLNQQAQVIAYNDDYKVLTLATLSSLPLLFMLKRKERLVHDPGLMAE